MINIFRKKRNGSITLEATLVLPIVIITLLFIANILNICMVHVCMQQALNNTVKKISQDSYIAYRFFGEEKYASFIDKISEINEGYDNFDDEAGKAMGKFGELEKSVSSTVNSFSEFAQTFSTKNEETLRERVDQFLLRLDNLKLSINATKNNFHNFTTELNSLVESVKDNGVNVIKKLLLDTGTGIVGGTVSYILYSNYVKNLGVPASKIKNLNILHSSLNADGSFAFVIDYQYVNPFSFVNSESMEYSIINKTIRMANIITIKPFVGKNGTSLKNRVPKNKEKKEILVYIYEKSGARYHKTPHCGENYATEITLTEAKERGYTPCNTKNCFQGIEPTQ